MSLLRDIQNDAAKSDVDVTPLLRKCKILGARLGSNELDQWVDWELNGYPESQTVPEYRRITITYYASFLNGYWQVPQAAVPMQVVPEKYRESFSYIEFRDGIAKAESLARNEGHTTVERPELVPAIEGTMYPRMSCHRVWGVISRIEFEQLVSAVRNRTLDFSLKIEAQNPDAGEAAPNTQPVPPDKLQTIVYNTFYGNVGAIAQNSEHFTQTVTMTASKEEITKLVDTLDKNLSELNLNQRERQRAEAQLTTLRIELAGEPDAAVVAQASRTLRNITEGAIGSLLATAAQPSLWHWVQQTLVAWAK